ncbi:uncharacterized protein LOC143019922 [Oratosquilla oratoria]|uniref:uncharacterized protein LOC143019922 n=1 Tax=Oratosquilla oratoria TaxID=337810 RepID=UPI003F758CEB
MGESRMRLSRRKRLSLFGNDSQVRLQHEPHRQSACGTCLGGTVCSGKMMVPFVLLGLASAVSGLPQFPFFVNTSVPFSVAPQPVQDTPEVAKAKQQFLTTFHLIQNAVESAMQRERAAKINSSVKEVDASTSVSQFSVFPDPDLEPEYFMPSVHVESALLQSLDTPLPQYSYIEEFRELVGAGKPGQTCYEIVVLVPETDPFSFNDVGSSKLLSLESAGSSNLSSEIKTGRGENSVLPLANAVHTQAATSAGLVDTSAVPNHFRAPQFSFAKQTVTFVGR